MTVPRSGAPPGSAKCRVHRWSLIVERDMESWAGLRRCAEMTRLCGWWGGLAHCALEYTTRSLEHRSTYLYRCSRLAAIPYFQRAISGRGGKDSRFVGRPHSAIYHSGVLGTCHQRAIGFEVPNFGCGVPGPGHDECFPSGLTPVYAAAASVVSKAGEAERFGAAAFECSAETAAHNTLRTLRSNIAVSRLLINQGNAWLRRCTLFFLPISLLFVLLKDTQRPVHTHRQSKIP